MLYVVFVFRPIKIDGLKNDFLIGELFGKRLANGFLGESFDFQTGFATLVRGEVGDNNDVFRLVNDGLGLGVGR